MQITKPNNFVGIQRNIPLLTGVFFAFTMLCWPARAWALQPHGAPEGLYVHQMAHIFFMGALAYLYWDVKRTSFTGIGWRFLQIFCILFFLWNGAALLGHWMTHLIDEAAFDLSKGYWWSELRYPLGPIKLLFYFTRMDHLFSLPALFFLMLSLRSFYRQAIKDKADEGVER